MEQCSSEQTALYKTLILEHISPQLNPASDTTSPTSDHCITTESAKTGFRPNTLLDLTGGFGVDFFYMSKLFSEAHYVERQPELCAIASHNFALVNASHLFVHNSQAEDFLAAQPSNSSERTIIFLDPARRDANGGKVFRLQDCEPNVVVLMQQLMQHAHTVLLKLSPMLDISEALRSIGGATQVHVVAVRNEVKEVLILICKDDATDNPQITCVNLESADQPFTYLLQQENDSPSPLMAMQPQGVLFLYEPNAAIMKAGAYKLLAERFHLHPLSANTHLYTSDLLVNDFPGRIFRAHPTDKTELTTIKQANIICRNYPLRPDELKKKYKLRDGGELYLIGAKVDSRPALFLAQRLK